MLHITALGNTLHPCPVEQSNLCRYRDGWDDSDSYLKHNVFLIFPTHAYAIIEHMLHVD